MPKKNRTEKEILESIEKLLILLLIKNGLKSEDISRVIDKDSSTIRKMYPKSKK